MITAVTAEYAEEIRLKCPQPRALGECVQRAYAELPKHLTGFPGDIGVLGGECC
jgi:hypothetical protein